MFLRLISSADWRKLLDFISPKLFTVLPTSTLRKQLGEQMANYRNTDGFRKLLSAHKADLEIPPVALADTLPQSPQSEMDRVERGQAMLRLFFTGVCNLPEAAMDLRHDRFQPGPDGQLLWQPEPLWVKWDPAFRSAISKIYAGFYTGESTEFEVGLDELGLLPAREVFEDQFGFGGQEQQRFSLEDYHASFHAVFKECKAKGLALHPNFIALGIFLACLYEHLERLDVPLNPKAACNEVLSHVG